MIVWNRKWTKFSRYLDSNQIVARDVFGEFKISVSSLNPTEIAAEKKKVAAQFKTAVISFDYNFAAKSQYHKTVHCW